MTIPYLAPPKDPADITSGQDRFRCLPYACEMFARACVERQAQVDAGMHRHDFAKCTDCELGRLIKAKSGVVVDMSEVVAREKSRSERAVRHRKLSVRQDIALRVLDGDAPTVPTIGASLPARGLAELAEEQAEEEAEAIDETAETFQAPTEQEQLQKAEAYREKRIPIGDGRVWSDIACKEIVTVAPAPPELDVGFAGTYADGRPVPTPPDLSFATFTEEQLKRRREVNAHMARRPEPKEKPMPTCKHPTCDKIVRPGKMKNPLPPGAEGFCAKHIKDFVRKVESNGQPSDTPEVYEEKLKAKRSGKPAKAAKLKRTKREVREVDLPKTPAVKDLSGFENVLAHAIEAVRLVELIGWDTARALAARMGG